MLGDLALKQTSLNLYTSNASPVFLCQIIMLRLQQVTFMALHNFLGLSYELIASVSTQLTRLCDRTDKDEI